MDYWITAIIVMFTNLANELGPHPVRFFSQLSKCLVWNACEEEDEPAWSQGDFSICSSSEWWQRINQDTYLDGPWS